MLLCLLQVTQIWVYDIKHTELFNPFSFTHANSTNRKEKCGLLFIKCRWVSFFRKHINRCLNLGTCAVTSSGIFWIFLSAFLHWSSLCCVFERSLTLSLTVEPGLFWCFYRVLFIHRFYWLCICTLQACFANLSVFAKNWGMLVPSVFKYIIQLWWQEDVMNNYFHYLSNCAGWNWRRKSAWNGHFFPCLPAHSVLGVQLEGLLACLCFSSFSKSTIPLSLGGSLLTLLAF